MVQENTLAREQIGDPNWSFSKDAVGAVIILLLLSLFFFNMWLKFYKNALLEQQWSSIHIHCYAKDLYHKVDC